MNILSIPQLLTKMVRLLAELASAHSGDPYRGAQIAEMVADMFRAYNKVWPDAYPDNVIGGLAAHAKHGRESTAAMPRPEDNRLWSLNYKDDGEGAEG